MNKPLLDIQDERFENNIFHDVDHEHCRRRLGSLYGRVAHAQNLFISRHLKGRKILDAGAGYGTLTRDLRALGFDTIGGEIHPQKIILAREWYGIELDLVDIYNTQYPDAFFDSVVLREVVFHLDFEKAFPELARIAKEQILIFQGNDVKLRKLGQFLYSHKEFNERNPAYYRRVCESHGWRVDPLQYRDSIAFPLSGGFIGREWSLPYRWFQNALLWLDNASTACLRATHLDRYFCFRFLLSATRAKST